VGVRATRTLLEFCVAKQGVRRGATTAGRVVQYAIAAADLGHVPTNDEYCEWWACSERTGWADRERMREVFGDDWRSVVEALAAATERQRSRSPRVLMQLPVPRAVTA
jgi:hypothetical protein